jgi:hypothetical protein
MHLHTVKVVEIDQLGGNMNIDLSRFKVIYKEKVLKAISLQAVEFPEDTDWEAKNNLEIANTHSQEDYIVGQMSIEDYLS